MRIGFAVDEDKGMESSISGHFGRCPYYIIVDVEGREVKEVSVLSNPFYPNNAPPGKLPALLNEQGVEVMVAGGMGPRAVEAFRELGIEVFTGACCTVKEALEAYLKGELKGGEPCEGHDELKVLKDQADALQRQLDVLLRQIAELEGR